MFALLPSFQAGGQFRVVSLLKQRFIVGSRLIVIASQIGQLLFAYRLAIQSSLIVGDALPLAPLWRAPDSQSRSG